MRPARESSSPERADRDLGFPPRSRAATLMGLGPPGLDRETVGDKATLGVPAVAVVARHMRRGRRS